LLKKGIALVERDLGKDPLSKAELKDLFGDRDPREFLNPRNELYREMRMAGKPPSPAETIRLMAKNPNLIRRPIVVRGRDKVAGFDEQALLRLVSSWDTTRKSGQKKNTHR
jgi:arsenate reductase-like glutaredoxin family protein